MEEPTEFAPTERDTSHTLKLQFTGSGSEYFRIWIVNLLLTLVTLGIYFPWAKVRKLRYFYGNTLVGGEPLGFHGDPKKMFKGYVLVAVLFGCYSAAGHFSATASLLALLVIAALWPALLKSSLQFRLSNTSWRGLRFRFTGGLADAYKAALPLYAPGALFIGLSPLMRESEASTQRLLAKLIMVLVLLSLLLGPWLFWRLKKYQHDNYALGSQQTDLRASTGSFYKLALKILGLYVASFALAGFLFFILATSGAMGHTGGSDSSSHGAPWLLVLAMPILAGLMFFIYAYVWARTQNLLWGQTASSHVRFDSQLEVLPLFWLTAKNYFFMAITLGLYWPFAAIATQRLRLQAVSLDMAMAPELLVSDGLGNAEDATGVAAGDFFGFDIGL